MDYVSISNHLEVRGAGSPPSEPNGDYWYNRSPGLPPNEPDRGLFWPFKLFRTEEKIEEKINFVFQGWSSNKKVSV